RSSDLEFAGGQAKNFPIVIGEGRMLPEFETAVTGIEAGGSKAFDLTFPADYHGKEVAGKPAHFALTALSVEQANVPALDEAFVNAFGIASGNVDDLRREVEANLKLELKRKIESSVKAQALSALRRQASFDVPKSLVESEAQLLRERAIANLREQRNVKAEDVEVSTDLFRPQ